MWITKKAMVQLIEDHQALARRVESLEDHREEMDKRISKIAKATAGIEYGESYLHYYIGFRPTIHARSKITVSEAVKSIIAHLKLDITMDPAVPEVPATPKLIKSKPSKPKK